MNVIMYTLIVLLSGGITILLFRQGHEMRIVHRALKRELRPIRIELKKYEHNPAKQFELLDPVYRKVVFQVHPKLKMKRT
ncbi:hypothetical protein A6395_05575 [Exiguobacterium sp. SH31]|uniref:hypothetical protein n=1 Tax=Exiguobacterium sp. SH31 TaxID=1843183 RepID=UPI0008B68D0B|nr:hypothetical protein [Exiguobacterium sp. SH31]OGX79700.1 hypothetical protein A6395_05575 [Exiguobacterium sp. SH31]